MLEALQFSERGSASHNATPSFSELSFFHVSSFSLPFLASFLPSFPQPFSILSPLLAPPNTYQMGFVMIVITLDCSSVFYEPPWLHLLSYQERIWEDSRFRREVIIHWSLAITLLANGGGRESGECVYSSSSHIKCQHFTVGVSGDWAVVLLLLTCPSCFCSASHCCSKKAG